MKDYHSMLNILLRSFKEAQKSPIIWKFQIENLPIVTVSLKIPVMFVIGDTEGHDKLCGRYSSRKQPTRLCRYCTIPFSETDDPFAKFKYQKCKQIEDLVENGREEELKMMSFHCIKNAWSDVHFCDSKRGIFGATLAELLHCLQQGIFEYGIKALYAQRKIKKGKRKRGVRKKKNNIKKRKQNQRNKKRKIEVEEEEEEEENNDDDDSHNDDDDDEKVVYDDDDDNNVDGDDDEDVDNDEKEEKEEEEEEGNDNDDDENEDDDDEDEEEDNNDDVDDLNEEEEDDDSEYDSDDEEVDNDIPNLDDDEEEEILNPQDETAEEEEEEIEYSSHYVFPQEYCASFDNLCRKYGKYLQHQSDRQLPRTYFNSSYIKIAKKNAHEMAGILLVYLMVFSSKEGENNLFTSLGDQRLADFTHCFELFLCLENFCKQTSHQRKDLSVMKKGMPLIMDFIKSTLNRQDGNGMKIVKFHLLLHYVDDVKRFGSMRNYDSCIGERHHCTEVKDPAQQTQRRKVNFEKQTALRYYDNLLISRGQREFVTQKVNPMQSCCQYKNKNIIYDHRYRKLYKKDSCKKLRACHWKDKKFQKALVDLCESLVESGKVKSPILFFTQHNRDELIFRACPKYNDNDPWYDWAYVDWGDEVPVPAKLLLFMDLSDNLSGTFQVGSSFVTEPGYYAVAYTCETANNPLKTMDTLLVEYNQLIMEDKDISKNPQLCMFNVESILSTCVAVPFIPHDTIINAESWCFLRPKQDWQEHLLNHLKISLK
jgi:hypothetical protein